MKVYLDHGAATPVDPRVVEAMFPYFTEEFGNPSSLHRYGRTAREAVERSRAAVSESINAAPEEVVFTSGGSESDNLALRGIAYGLKGKGRHIITSSIEHPAVLETCRSLEVDGFKVSYLGVDGEGFVDAGELEAAITGETILVSIMHANNEIGTIQDIEALGGVCSKHGVAFHTDAVQSYTKTPVDVQMQNLSLASFSAHKIHGPKGVGALYVRGDLKPKVVKQVTGGHHEFDLRAGTENVAGIVGFAKALSLADESRVEYMRGLRDRLTEGLLRIPDAVLNGPTGDRRLCNNVNVTFNGILGDEMLLELDMMGIAVSTGSACGSGDPGPSHVLAAIGRSPVDAQGTVRLTLGWENTREEIAYAIDSVGEVVAKLRGG